MSQTRLNNTQTLTSYLSEMEAMKPVGTEDMRSIGFWDRSANLASKSEKLLLAIHRTYESIGINH